MRSKWTWIWEMVRNSARMWRGRVRVPFVHLPHASRNAWLLLLLAGRLGGWWEVGGRLGAFHHPFLPPLLPPFAHLLLLSTHLFMLRSLHEVRD